jgi:glycogen synthase
MNQFLANQISEKQLLKNTPLDVAYNALYLCSVTTLPEASGKGKTFQLCMQTIHEMMQTHVLQYLFVWPFTKAGEALANKIAHASHLKLLIKQ